MSSDQLLRTLGTCYYPEHWPQEQWAADARAMVDTGLTWVRIGEFAWSRLEAVPGTLTFDWLDRAIETLGSAGLKVVLGTPTATPPRWMVDRYPDMIAVDADGRPRKFGSRRHYCFSHEGYRGECLRITEILARHYGANPHVAAWQTDNEYGCHDTTHSYSDAARVAFRGWLQVRYDDIDALNTAWGNVFWSMEYTEFDQIDLPNLTVTDPNPAHALAFRRFSSDQVVTFNRSQAQIIRAHSNAPSTHNYMGRITDFDHFAVGEDLDFSCWDSYPLGFLEDRVGADPDHQRRFAHQGDPDFQAFHHDLYRTVGKGRWWVMEQQPGPVNWAPYNPAPLAGMVRLWSWEAFAHGAEAVCYFRWRQAPFAQEQMHAGLMRPDGAAAPALEEARLVAQEIASAPVVSPVQARAALIFDYDADFAWKVQPHGQGLSYFQLVFDVYRAMRSLGLSIDILPASTRDFTGYSLICAPGLITMTPALKSALTKTAAQVVLGPRNGARTSEMCMPTSPLAPNIAGLDMIVTRVESLRPDTPIPLAQGGSAELYREELEGTAPSFLTTTTGTPVSVETDNLHYVGAFLDLEGWQHVLRRSCARAKLEVMDLPGYLRVRDTGHERFWFNYDTQHVDFEGRMFPSTSVTRDEL